MEREDYANFMNGLKTSIGAEVPADKKQQFHDELQKISSEYKSYLDRVQSAASGTTSAFIAGGSNFNQRQASRRGSAYDRATSDFSEWKDKAEKRLLSITGVGETRAAKQAQEKASKAEQRIQKRAELWDSLKPGDELPIGNSNGNPKIAKKNAMSVVTTNGT